MRLFCALSLVFAVGMTNSAVAQNPDIQSRYTKACMLDGDTDAYCRCEFEIVRNLVKDEKELEWFIEIADQLRAHPGSFDS